MELNLFIIVVLAIFISTGAGIENAKRLYNDIGTKADESKFWRPVENDQSIIFVYLGVTFIQIMNVDEKKKILTISVWLRQIWKNKDLSWNPNDYDGIKSIYLPHNTMWLPDIVLFNNADGKYETQFPNKPILYYNGLIDWKSPAIFQSTCEIDVRYFPYDEQTCYLNFGSWTYNKKQVKLRHIKQLEVLLEQLHIPQGSEKWKWALNVSRQRNFSDGAFLTNYHKSGEWDLMETPAIMSKEEDHDTPYDFIRFGVKIRRKIMFYNINLIFPLVGMSVLAALSFYLPVNSCEKIDLSTLILFAIAVFFVLLGESVPPSSLVTPIINQYLITTFLLISLSVFTTIFVLNIHFRTTFTDEFTPRLIKKSLLKYLPRVLFLKLPPKNDHLELLRNDFLSCKNTTESIKKRISTAADSETNVGKFDNCFKSLINGRRKQCNGAEVITDFTDNDGINEKLSLINRQIKEACTIISQITDELIKEIKYTNIQNEYMLAALVLDRLILFIFCFSSLVVVLVTYLQSPILYDNSKPVNQIFYNDSNLNKLLFQQL